MNNCHGLEGQGRIDWLEDSILNLQCQILERLDSIQTMQDEIQQIRGDRP